MTELNTDFSVSPYFDDYDEDKQFYRILFRPRTAVQARELTQLQTIIQNQISRFGDHIFKDGSVVDGVNITYLSRLDYVHVANQFNGANLSVVTDIANTYLITNSLDSNTAVRAVPIIAKNGFVSAFPNTNRIYLRYVSTGKDGIGNDQITFSSGDTLYIFDGEQNKFETLDSNNVIETINTLSANTTGRGYGISIGDGIIYQKGYFARVEPQTITIRDFDQNVDNYLVGFDTTESIVTSAQDTSLLDQSAGFSNFNAPGADRLKLNPVLLTYERDSPDLPENFFAIVEFDGVTASQERVDPVYERLGNVLARTSVETNGDFVVKPFSIEPLRVANSMNFAYEVSSGIAYINGYRVELTGTKRILTNRATTTRIAQNQIITANYGNYINVDELSGIANGNDLSEIILYDEAQNSVSSSSGNTLSPTGNIVGRANVKTVTHGTGIKGNPECVYQLYLFNIRMETNKNFLNDVKSVYGTSSFGTFVADVVLESSRAVLKDSNRSVLVFNTGLTGVSTYEPGDANDTSYTFRQTSTATMAANGSATFTIPSAAPGGSERIGFSPGVLSDGNELSFNIYYSANSFSANQSGTLEIVSGNTTIIGTNTQFTTEITSNTNIRINMGGGTFLNRRVVSIANNTLLTIDNAIGSSNSTSNFQKFFPAGSTINLAGANNVTVVSNTQFIVSTGTTLDSGSLVVSAQYPVIKTTARSSKKLVKKERFVKLDFATHPNTTNGPWILGIPDVYKIEHIYIGGTYDVTNPDRKEWFILDKGQRDSHYDHARLIIKPRFKSLLSSSNKILVVLSHFEPDTTVGVGFFNVDSYPIDDNNITANTSAIATAEIPIYLSSSGGSFNLRNAIDVRPYKVMTANSVATSDPANTFITINPISNNNFNVFSSGQYLAEVDSNITVDVEYYLPRRDLLLMNKRGELTVKQGIPEEIPKVPFHESDSTIIAEVILSPFPSLTPNEAALFNREDLRTKIVSRTNRRYTMKDIGNLDKRLKRIEYYTVLNTLEQQAKDLTIPSAIDPTLDRFKNGIFADPFNSHANGRVEDFEYSISMDPREKVARPAFSSKPIDFKFNLAGSNNVFLVGTSVILPFVMESYIVQPFATSFRNPSSGSYQWNGNILLFPSRDYFVDDRSGVNIVEIDFSQPWLDFANGPRGKIYGDWRTSGSSSSSSTNTSTSGLTTTSTTTTTTNTTQNRIIDEILVDVINNTYDFGNYVKDYSVSPHIRPQLIAFVGSVKPNTRMYAFFDGIPVSAHCAPGILNPDLIGRDIIVGKEYQKVTQTAEFGEPLVSDSQGRIFGLFRVPSDTFRVGDRTFMLVNVDDLVAGKDSIITSARSIFSASSVSITREQLVLSTQEPILSFDQNIESRTISDTSTSSSSVTTIPDGPDTIIIIEDDDEEIVEPDPIVVEPDPIVVEPDYEEPYQPIIQDVIFQDAGPTGPDGTGGDSGTADSMDPSSGSGGGGGGGDSIVCTSLYKMGLISEEVYRLDEVYGEYIRMTDPAVYIGYRVWAEPLSRFILKDTWTAKVIRKPVAFFGNRWAQHMAHTLEPNNHKDSLVGRFVMLIGKPSARLLGNLINRIERVAGCYINRGKK